MPCNGYVPNLQVGGQVVSFLTQHLESDPVSGDSGEDRHRVSPGGGVVRRGQPDPGGAVRQARPQDRRDAPISGAAGTGRSGVAAIGVAQEFAPVFTATKKQRGKTVRFPLRCPSGG